MISLDRSPDHPEISADGMPAMAPGVPAPDTTLIEVLTQLALRKWLVAKVTCVTILLGVTVCWLLPVRYTATTKIMPPQQSPSSAAVLMSQLATGGAGSLAAAAGTGLGLKNPNDLYLGLLNSRPVADGIIEKFNLRRLYRARDMTTARKKLAESTTVASEKNGFILVSVVDTDKARAAAMANAYTEELRAITRRLAVTEASKRRLFYEDQLKLAQQELVTATVAFAQVQQKRGLVELDAQAKAMIEGLAAMRAEVGAKEVELEAMRSYSTEHNPAVQLAERELSSLKAELTGLESKKNSSGFAELGLGDVPGGGMEYLGAEHEVKYRQALLDLLLKQWDVAKLDEAKEAAIIQVLEPAIEPDRKSSPHRALILIGFTLAGLLGGSMIALFCWYQQLFQLDADRSLRLRNLKYAFLGKTDQMVSL